MADGRCGWPRVSSAVKRPQASSVESGAAACAARVVRWVLAASLVGSAVAQPGGTSVSLSGRMGSKALLVINGSPRAVAVGSTEQGVKLLSLGNDVAVVEVEGRRQSLLLGATPVNLSGAPSAGAGTRIVLSAGSGGHFTSAGSINGRPVLFMVDTGASLVALSQSEADRIGLDYRKSPRGLVQTANGTVAVHSVRLSNLRLGDVQVYDVAAVVMPAQMPTVLLGNSFLNRFQMKRENDTMTLDKRP